jgi:hypothetical protein
MYMWKVSEHKRKRNKASGSIKAKSFPFNNRSLASTKTAEHKVSEFLTGYLK